VNQLIYCVRIGWFCVISGEFFKLRDWLCRSLCIVGYAESHSVLWGVGYGGVLVMLKSC
jgi:hypothetical protein